MLMNEGIDKLVNGDIIIKVDAEINTNFLELLMSEFSKDFSRCSAQLCEMFGLVDEAFDYLN
jgi:hypothetical protein